MKNVRQTALHRILAVETRWLREQLAKLCRTLRIIYQPWSCAVLRVSMLHRQEHRAQSIGTAAKEGCAISIDPISLGKLSILNVELMRMREAIILDDNDLANRYPLNLLVVHHIGSASPTTFPSALLHAPVSLHHNMA